MFVSFGIVDTGGQECVFVCANRSTWAHVFKSNTIALLTRLRVKVSLSLSLLDGARPEGNQSLGTRAEIWHKTILKQLNEPRPRKRKKRIDFHVRESIL